MSEFQPLIDQLYREEVERARAQTPSQRLADVFSLSQLWFGTSDPELRRRLALIRERDERDCYGPPQPRL